MAEGQITHQHEIEHVCVVLTTPVDQEHLRSNISANTGSVLGGGGGRGGMLSRSYINPPIETICLLPVTFT